MNIYQPHAALFLSGWPGLSIERHWQKTIIKNLTQNLLKSCNSLQYYFL